MMLASGGVSTLLSVEKSLGKRLQQQEKVPRGGDTSGIGLDTVAVGTNATSYK